MWKRMLLIVLLFALSISIIGEGVISMANKYCNLQGNQKIKDSYTNINTGFDKVDADISGHIKGTSSKHNAEVIIYSGSVPGANVKQAIDNLNNRVDEIIVTPAGSVSAQEIIDARGGETSLGGRLNMLDSQFADYVKYSSQIDFIQLIESFTKYKRLRFRRTSNTLIELVADNGKNHVTYQLKKDTNDDFWKLDDCFVGNLSYGIIDYRNYESTTGTWVTLYTPNHYTTEVGATFTAYVKGTDLKFVHFSDDRGGIWEFVIDDDTENPITISTWAESPTNNVVDNIASNLESKVHKVVATFKGADPNHTPSETARGWCNFKAPEESYVGTYPLRGYDYDILNQKAATLMYPNSNKEMALQVDYNGTVSWIPDHGVGTAFAISPLQLIVDGVEDTTVYEGWEWVECDEIKIIQRLYGKISNTNVAEITVTHYLSKNGVLNYNVTLKALQNITVNASYPCMLVTDDSVLNEFVTGLLNSRVNSSDNETIYFSEEKDKVYSACAISSGKPNYIAAATIEIPLISMRVGKETGKPEIGKDMRVWNRPIEPKLYWQNAENLDLESGDTLSWAGKFAIAVIENIYRIVKASS